ncbi:hypothetical protein B0O99DRAFT_653503 [Bisporella sp. PMI_857]|nr:hypothetical protein B0O99DRAFT_653503 [Bisporella sp. PMI_857]
MLSSTSYFIASSISIYHNAIKSLIFTAAQLLFAMSVYKFFSLIASKANLFTSYLMFMEDFVQKVYFIFSRGFSPNSVMVLCFAVVYAAAGLYGTLLWGLDAPGYIFQGKNVSASTLNNSLLGEPAYILYLDARRNNLAMLDKELPHMIGANLFKPGVNFTLTSEVNRGVPQVVAPTRSKVGGRVWLDTEGLSVSPDTQVMVSFKKNDTGPLINMDCPVLESGKGVAQFWNCTFNNSFVDPLLTTIIGIPEVHWDNPSDLLHDSRYIKPDRKKNIWAAFGQGGGTAVMKQMFTVTKGTRRYSFIETTFRCTMLTMPGVPFSSYEVADILKRTWSTNATEQQAPLIKRLSNSIARAQDQNQSFLFGVNDATDLTTTQVNWEYLTSELEGSPLFSVLRVSITNITLVRSETIAVTPTPFASCDTSIQNLAYAGVVSDTDCATAKQGMGSVFYGQVDTSAVLILYGLGDGRSNISSIALDEKIYEWSIESSRRMDDLLVSRGFIVSVNASLVTLEMVLVLLTVLLAALGWICLRLFSSSHWSSSLLSNLLAPTGMTDDKKQSPGYISPCQNHDFPKSQIVRTHVNRIT